MGTLGTRLKNLRTEKGLTQSELAKKFNLSKPAISMYENDRNSPNDDLKKQFSNFFNVSMDYLMGISDNRHGDKNFLVPVVGEVVCGNPTFAEEEILDWEELSYELKNTGEYFGLKIKGDSMLPKFSPGDVVIVRKQPDVENGEIGIVKINGDDATLKIIHKSDQGITLVATNPSVYPPHFYTKKDVETLPLAIIGKVIELRAKF